VARSAARFLGWLDQYLGPRVGMLLAGGVPAIATTLVVSCA
jgi:hypothetical protein